MKEIIYLDKTMLDSYLAQLHSGLTNKLSTSTQMDLTESEGTNNTNNLHAKLLGVNLGTNKQTNNSTVYTKRNSESYEVAYHDYALDVLLDTLNSPDTPLIQNGDYSEGQFVLPKGKIKLYDFKRLEQIAAEEISSIFNPLETEKQLIREQIKSLKHSKDYKRNKSAIDQEIKKLQFLLDQKNDEYLKNFTYVHKLGKLGNALFPDSCLVKISDFICVCPKENFRINEATLSLFNETTRAFNCLAVILYQRGPEYIKTDADGNVSQLPVETIASSAPTMFVDILLNNFDLSKPDDYVIRPLAIYYDND